jgi:uncharacterized protein
MCSRPRKHRNCRKFQGDSVFKPRAIPLSDLEIVELQLDELEAMRLCDHEDMEQEEAANKINISRQTLQRALYSGRKKVVDSIINSKAIRISGDENDEAHRHGKGNNNGNTGQ